jgi:hypothetical protein
VRSHKERARALGPPNKALKLTKGAEVRAPRHSASLRRRSVPRSTFFTNVPSQLNAVFCGPL